MRQTRGSLYLLTGLLLGIGLGLVFAWVLKPPSTMYSEPDSLQVQSKEKYRTLIATSFLATGDLVRASSRLELLGDDDPYQAILVQVDRKAGFGETGEVTALRLLAQALGRFAMPRTETP